MFLRCETLNHGEAEQTLRWRTSYIFSWLVVHGVVAVCGIKCNASTYFMKKVCIKLNVCHR
jgi:hypothetical protein